MVKCNSVSPCSHVICKYSEARSLEGKHPKEVNARSFCALRRKRDQAPCDTHRPGLFLLPGTLGLCWPLGGVASLPSGPKKFVRDTVNALSFSLQSFLSFHAWHRSSSHCHINPAPCQHLRKWLCHRLHPTKTARLSRLLPLGGFWLGVSPVVLASPGGMWWQCSSALFHP